MDVLFLGGIIKLLDKGAAIILLKILRKHSNELLELDKKILAADQAFLNDTDNRDDLEYVELRKQRIAVEAAMRRDVLLAGSAAPDA